MKKKKLKNIHPVIPHRSTPTAPLFLAHIPRGFPQKNLFPKLSSYVGQKFNTV